jgi:hypothetical protein
MFKIIILQKLFDVVGTMSDYLDSMKFKRVIIDEAT